MQLVAVAVPAPLYRCFDYRVPDDSSRLRPGMRVRVPFGRRHLIGVVAQPARPSDEPAAPAGQYKYKLLEAILDDAPLFDAELLGLCHWAADYYQHPLGEVLAAAMPGPLRRGAAATLAASSALQLTAAGHAALAQLPVRQHARRALLHALRVPQTRAQLRAALPGAAAQLKHALAQAWVEPCAENLAPLPPFDAPIPTAAQAAALHTLAQTSPGFGVTLLEGVTGSGKTEIYLRAIAQVCAAGRQALVLVPEIGLTPQIIERFTERFGAGVMGFHSGMSESARAHTWLSARAGRAAVVIGTRSAIFVPLPRLGLIVVDEEHDVSYKQQEGFRYSARDAAIVRAQRAGVPIILGSATPSLESLHNARQGRYRHLHLAGRVHSAAPPRVQLIDMRQHSKLEHGLSPPLLDAITRHVEAGGQALLFINRRGYAPVLLCRACGWSAPCRQCDAHLTLHRGRGRLICHHCGAQQAVPAACPACAAHQLTPVGQGTERIEDTLRNLFPRQRVERFDSDRVRRAGELERLLGDIRSRAISIVVGTQILAKGHDFAGLTLVGIVSADQALYGSDFRAIERMGQLVTQVAGRAGRATTPGEVLLQTHQPEHPLLQRLISGGYGALCDAVLEERRAVGLPPYAHLALLRADSLHATAPLRFLTEARALLPAGSKVQAFEPIPASMEQRAGRTRAQLLLQSASRPILQRALVRWVTQLDGLPTARRVRWSMDVDPYDLY